MRLMMFTLVFIVGVSSGCSQKKKSLSEYEYQRSNSVSEKALEKLDRE